jgi:hypothetical protein
MKGNIMHILDQITKKNILTLSHEKYQLKLTS